MKPSRVGLMLFALYCAVYLGFVLINTFAPDRMQAASWGGLNLSIVYGFALIALAVVLSLIYGLVRPSTPYDAETESSRPLTTKRSD